MIPARRQNGSSAEQFPVVNVQLYHPSSSKQRDDHQRGISFFIVADKWAEPVGLVGSSDMFLAV